MKKKYGKTPTVYQMEAAECGAASLAMIFAYHGKHIPLEQMRVETGVSRDGCNAGNIMRAAEKFGMEAKGYRVSLDCLLELEPPCMIHWNFNHFVVFEGTKGKYYYINDPGAGRRKLAFEELDEAFTGVALTFVPTSRFEKTKRKDTMISFLRERLAGQYGPLLALAAAGLLLILPGLLLPVFSQIFIDEILLGGNQEWLAPFLTVMAFTLAFQAGISGCRDMLLQKLQNRMSLSSAYQFLYHMLRLPMNFFDQRYAGDLANRVENNNNISSFLAGDLAETMLNLCNAVFYFVFLIFYSPILTLVGVCSIALHFALVGFRAKMVEDLTMKMQQDEGKMTGAVYAGLSITQTLKSSGAENGYVSRILGYYAAAIRQEQKLGKIQQTLNAVPEAFQGISNILVLMLGGILVIKGNMTAGSLTAYMVLLTSFTAPLHKLVEFVRKIHKLKADIGRVADIMKYDADEKFREAEEKEILTAKLSGEVELRDITFGYSRLEQPVVEHFQFHLECGHSIALTGPSGSGKSTVSRIVSGLYLPWTGEVLIDGIPLNKIPKEILSSSVATVSQDITLFSGTIRDNITMWNHSILESDLIRAAKDACIHDVITRKPGGYEYRLTQGGSNLSGGQRQRLEIARALVVNPTVLIMDEATSALDPLLEKQIMDNIKRRGCTCILAAHRLSAVRDCDEIIVMEQGRAVQRGPHESLIEQEGCYRELMGTDRQ